MGTQRSWNHQCQGWSHVPHGGVGGLAQRGTGWWSWSPPDAALDRGTPPREGSEMLHWLTAFPPLQPPAEHLWAPLQLPCCSQNLLRAEGDMRNLVAKVSVGSGPSCPVTQFPSRPPLSLRHGGMVPSLGELLPLQCALSQRQSPKRPFRSCLGMSPMATPHSSEPAESCSLPTGTSLPSRTERSVAIPSPAKKRTTLVSAVVWGRGGQPNVVSSGFAQL